MSHPTNKGESRMKTIRSNADTKLLYQSDWLIEQTVHFRSLTICPRANLTAPEGKYVSLVVDGLGRDLVPGTYEGDVVLAVSDLTEMPPHALMRQNDISAEFQTALVVDDSGAHLTTPELIPEGTITDTTAENIYIGTTAQSYNGILVKENAEYHIKDSDFDFEGFGCNDFMGVGAAVAAVDNARVTIDDSRFHFSGVTRCPIHVGGRSNVVVNNCDVVNFSDDGNWPGDFSWQIALIGTNRLCQLADGAKAEYHGCNLITNGWGITSIDGTNEPVSLLIDRCKLRLVGPRSHGYGAFCIGGNTVTIQDSDVRVNGYPMLVMGMEDAGRPSILRSKIRGRRFGAMVYSDMGSIFNIEDSDIQTGKSTLCVKGSNTVINVKNTKMVPGNGTILQLMDNDECGMSAQNYKIPVGEIDVYQEGRKLSEIDPEYDIVLNIADCDLKGDFLNSTTNLRADKRCDQGGRGLFHDTLAGLPGMDDGAEPMGPGGPGGPPPGGMPKMKDNRCPKNVALNFTNTRVEGVISSATQAYREGLTEITEKNRIELSNVTQTPAPTVNNGVIVTLDGSSVWTVTDTSYITALTVPAGAKLIAPAGKTLTMTVDGVETAIGPGSYAGKIVLTVS